MRDALFYLDRESDLSLRQQIRQKLVDGIRSGAFPGGTRLPSSRKLAQQLRVSRNTVVSVYQDLIADGYIVSRQRSGIFVNDDVAKYRLEPARESGKASSGLLVWPNRIKYRRVATANADEIANWNAYPYAFLDGRFDASLFPLSEWREANKLALGVAAVEDWSTGDGDDDDPSLIHEIRTKFLTRRGIQASDNEVLLTLGTQNSLYLIARLLADSTAVVGIEEPGNFRMRSLVEARGATVRPQTVDEDGIRIDAKIDDCDWIYVTPSHQIPTAVPMSMERRRELVKAATDGDFLIVEDDYECELNYQDQPRPALRSMDKSGRVIYVAELSKVLSPGIGLGFIVADAAFIRRARELRRALFSHPPLYNQRAAAYFLSLGYYDSMMMRLGKTLGDRRLELRDALSNMRGVPLEISPEVGGTTYWVKAPRQFNVAYFVQEAAEHGILLEPVADYYQDPGRAENCFRMGITSIPQDKIVPGVRRLVELIRRLVRGQVEHLDTAIGTWLRGPALERFMSGAVIRYQEVYGTVCTIRLHADGRMSGDMESASEDTDTGVWRVEGDLFYRRWDRWNYAAEAAYYIVVDGDTVKYFNHDRQIVDSAKVDPAGIRGNH